MVIEMNGISMGNSTKSRAFGRYLQSSPVQIQPSAASRQRIKKREFWVKHCIQSRKPVATVSAKISLHFSETSISNAVLPRSLTPTIRTLNSTYSCHAPFLHILIPTKFPKQKKGEMRGNGDISTPSGKSEI